MKKNFFSFKYLLIPFTLISVMLFCANPALSSAEEGQPLLSTITVKGSSNITVSPTIAYVNIGVKTFNKDAATAQSDNSEKMDLVYKTLASLGISKDKIKTVTYSISPHYDYKNNVANLAGYNVTNSIQVTVMNLKKVSDVLDMTVKQGVNQSNSITFSITDQEKETIYIKALAKAVTNAKEKASSIAAAAGVSISKPANIIEGSTQNFVPPNYRTMDMAKMEMAATPISGGELKIEANVTVIYNF